MQPKLTVVAPAIAAVVLSSCGGTTVTASPSASQPNLPTALGTTGKVLSEVKLSNLPEGAVFVSFIDVPQPAGNSLTDKHLGGFVYAVQGVQRLAVGAGPSKDLNPGEAAFIEDGVTHSHSNPGGSASDWYFVGIRPAAQRSGPLPLPQAKIVYATRDLAAFTPGTYGETLRVTTIQAGGRTAAHKHGGFETFIVLEGSVKVRVAGRSPARLGRGQGAEIPPGTPLQVFNDGSGDAKLLVFLATLEGVPFQTLLNASP